MKDPRFMFDEEWELRERMRDEEEAREREWEMQEREYERQEREYEFMMEQDRMEQFEMQNDRFMQEHNEWQNNFTADADRFCMDITDNNQQFDSFQNDFMNDPFFF